MIVNGCFIAFYCLFALIGNVNGRFWCQCVGRFGSLRLNQTALMGKVLALTVGAGRIVEPSVVFFLADTRVSEIYSARAKFYKSSKNPIFTSEIAV